MVQTEGLGGYFLSSTRGFNQEYNRGMQWGYGDLLGILHGDHIGNYMTFLRLRGWRIIVV